MASEWWSIKVIHSLNLCECSAVYLLLIPAAVKAIGLALWLNWPRSHGDRLVAKLDLYTPAVSVTWVLYFSP